MCVQDDDECEGDEEYGCEDENDDDDDDDCDESDDDDDCDDLDENEQPSSESFNDDNDDLNKILSQNDQTQQKGANWQSQHQAQSNNQS